ncbi:hypothetical protein CMI37_22850 [Candidatus Pacearchaeota archaeon]|nr:hypothetical protein [Candidatus Pacearchaeota archaeon]|tara:strand:+ start:2346 stop:2846 length:501 start_codon:yes stop_codon:yes gene_type:complete
MSWGHTRNAGYKPGNPWYRCDLTGEDYRQSDMRKQWDGVWVNKRDWEPRHPQDFVKGVKDHQAVYEPRPTIDSAIDNTTTTSAASSRGGFTVTLTDVTNVADGDAIGVTLDDALVQWNTVDGDPVGAVVTMLEALRDDVASGNTVYKGDDGSAHYLSTNEVSADDL